MLTLIKREIWDNFLFILVFIVLSALLVFISAWLAYGEEDVKAISAVLSVLIIAIAALGLCAMGSSQMYLDKNKKLSSFICTLATTRRNIFVARIITGLLVIVILMLPIFITTKVLIRLFELPVPFYESIVHDVFFTGFLMALSSYCVGLQTGWSSNKIFPTLGAVVLAIILLSLVIIKGFDSQIWLILLLFIIASLVRTWNNFKNAALV